MTTDGRTAPGTERPDGRQLAIGGGLSFVGSCLSALLGFACTIALTRLLGDAGAGVIFQATGIFAVCLAVGRMGLDSTAIWMLPRQQVSAPEQIRPTLLRMAGVSLLASGIVALVVGMAFGLGWASAEPTTASSIIACLWLLPAASLFLIGVAALRALGDLPGYVGLGSVALPALRLAVVAACAAAAASLAVVSVAWAAPFLLLIPWVVLRLGSVTPSADSKRGRRPLPAQTARSMRSYSLPRVTSAVLEQVVQWAGVLVCGALAGAATAGVYGSAARLIQAGMLVDVAIRAVVAPHFSRLIHVGDVVGTQRLYRTATRWLVLCGGPMLVLVAVHAPTILRVFGPDFTVGAWPLIVLCGGTLVAFCAGNVQSILLMSGHAGWAAVNKAIAGVVVVGGAWLLIPRIGIVGAAVAYAVAQMLDAALAAVQIRRFVGVRLEPATIASALGIVAGTVALPALAVLWMMGEGVAALVVGTVVSLALWCLALVLVRQRAGAGSAS